MKRWGSVLKTKQNKQTKKTRETQKESWLQKQDTKAEKGGWGENEENSLPLVRTRGFLLQFPC